MAYPTRTFGNSNLAARERLTEALPAPRRFFRTFFNSHWDSRDQAHTHRPSNGNVPNGGGYQRYPAHARGNQATQAPWRHNRTPSNPRGGSRDPAGDQFWTRVPSNRRGGNRHTRAPRTNQRVVTANEQFGLIISLVFEICQLRHHTNNWIELPKSIGRNIDNLFDSINLPRPNDDLANQKIVLKNILKHDLQETAQSHIQAQLDKALNKIKSIDPTDKDKCKHIVRNKITREIPKMNRESLDSWVEECIDLVGTQYTRISRSYSDALQNIERRQSVETRELQRDTDNMDSLDDSTLVKQPHTRNKRMLTVSPPISVSSRFDVLRDLETESPMKVPRRTVDEANVKQVRVKMQVTPRKSGQSGAAIEMRAVAGGAAAANATGLAGTGVTAAAAAADADTTGGTKTKRKATEETFAVTAVAAAELCAAAAAAEAEVTGGADAAEAAAEAGLRGGADTAGAASDAGVTGGDDAAGAAAEARVTDATSTTRTVAGETAGEGQASGSRIGRAAGTAGTEGRLCASQSDRRSSWTCGRAGALSLSQPTLDMVIQLGKGSGNKSNNTDTIQTGNKFVYQNWDKLTPVLQIQSKAANVILADSNFRYCQSDNEDFEIHVFPGANFIHALKLLQSAKIPNSVLNLIICIGINHRSYDYTLGTEPELRKLVGFTRKLKQTVYFLGISAPNLDSFENDNVTKINQYARVNFGSAYFIPPLLRNQVGIRPGDSFKIHHDTETMARVFRSIESHLSLN